MSNITRRQFLAMLGAGALGLSTYEYTSAYRVKVVRKEIRLPRWDADGLKVALLSDFHIADQPTIDRAKSAIRLALQEKPDIIVLVGDTFDADFRGNPEILDKEFEELFTAGIPTAIVMGNHEYATFYPLDIIKYLEASPVIFLRNAVHDIGGVHILGVDDPISGYAFYDQINFEKLSKSTICLMHEPDFCTTVPKPKSISIQLSGHTHGGQICLPFGVPVSRNPGGENYLAGYYPDAPMPLYVSPGIGTNRIDLRLFCPPEVNILTLRGAS
jgi:predicted MPP superfamily phosphohydrolase